MSATDEGGQVDTHAIRARVDAATEGPWEVDGGGTSVAAGMLWVAHVVDHQEPDLPVQARSDAEFIAHARTDIPALLDEVERLAGLAQRRTWERDGAEAILTVESTVRGDGLAADLAHVVVRADRADATIAAVRALHGRVHYCDGLWRGAPADWPIDSACPTLRILDGDTSDTSGGAE